MLNQQHDWELCKENIKPLRKGRRMENLMSALLPQCDPETYRTETVRQKQIFEAAIRNYSGDDPLQPWCAYIVWTEQNFPKGGKEGCLLELLQKCFDAFQDKHSYHNDSRFVQICLDLGDMSSDPLQLYQYMHGKGIGILLAAFYCKWAIFLENLGDIKRADDVFNEGIRINAEPKDELKMSYKLFMARLTSNIHETPNPETSAVSPYGEQRVALGGLKGTGSKHKVGTTRTGAAKLNCHTGLSSVAAKPLQIQSNIAVFCDENTPAKMIPPKITKENVALPTLASARKENEEKPGKWTNAKFLQKGVRHSSECKFVVYVEREAMQTTPQPVPISSSTALSTRKLDRPGFLRQVHCSEKPQKEGHQQKLMYCKEKLFNGITEFQFEELRAMRWREAQKKLEEKKLKEREESLQKREEELQNEIKQLNLVKEVVMGVAPDVLQEFIKCFHKNSTKCPTTVPTMKIFTPKLDSNHTASKEASGVQSASRNPAANLKSGSAQNGPLRVVSPEACQAAGSENSSTSNSNVKTKLQNSGTPHSQTMNCVRALWNDQAQFTEACNTEKLNSTIQTRVPFVVYGDDDAGKAEGFGIAKESLSNMDDLENGDLQKKSIRTPSVGTQQGLSRDHEHVESEDTENIQNIPPKDYVVPKSQRPLVGILMPSVNIPYALETGQQLLGVNDKEDDLDGIEPLDEFFSKEFSITCPSNTVFLSNLKLASTPFRMQQLHNVANDLKQISSENKPTQQSELKPSMENISKVMVSQPKGSNAGFLISPATQRPALHISPFNGPAIYRISGRPADLSAISETSREYKSSSSSGTSSNATSHFKTQLSRGKFSDAITANEKKENLEDVGISHQTASATTHSLVTFSTGKDIDPFDKEVTDSILNKLEYPVTERGQCFVFDYDMPSIREAAHLLLGNDKYLITKLCAKGGFAKVYTALDMTHELPTNTKVKRKNTIFALKVQKPACSWEFYISSELCSRVKKLQNFSADHISSFMSVVKFYIFNNGSILSTEYCPMGTLLDIVNLYTKRLSSMPESIALYFTIEILRIIDQVHACKIIHADVKPDNFILVAIPTVNIYGTTFNDVLANVLSSLRLVDYGRSIDMLAFPHGTIFTTSVKTDKFECNEMKDQRPWTYQSDFYGVAACSHVMLFGTYMNTVKENGKWRISTTLKRYWHRKEWADYFDTLLNIPSCDQRPDIDALRRSLGECLLKKLSELQGHLRHLSEMLPSSNYV